MFIRGTRVQAPPDKLEAAITHFKEKDAPAPRASPGNVGAALLVDRKTGAGVGITYWESAKAVAASEQMGIQTRTRSAAEAGTQIVNVERLELVIMDRTEPAKAGTFVRANTLNADPDKVDALTVFMRNQVLPVLKAQKGFRAVLMGVDRQTGRTVVSTTWNTLDDLHASEKAVSGLREEAAKAGGASGHVEVEIFEGAAVEMAAPVSAASGR